ncbi:restriction endonuclease subunit S [Chitinilyticum litopenaei]|uniref:restriction endonuclease subunit S n=1 Tax=Chitinilyticum litopenaei TaxID=1121276 RepID=UPI0009DC2F46
MLLALYGQGKTRGKVAILGFEASTNQACASIILNNKINREYIFHFLSSQYEKIRNASNSGGQENLSGQIIKNIQVPLPPETEQKEIASVLSNVDALLTQLDALIAKKRDLKQAAMQQLLTGQTRLPGFDGEWEVAELGELERKGLLRLFRGNVISKKDIENSPGEYPIYSSSVKQGGLFGCYGKFMFEEELITWSVDGGGDFFYRHPHRFSVTNVCGFIRVFSAQINCRFLAFQLDFLHGNMRFDYTSKAHPSIIRKAYKLILPSRDEQNAISTILTEMDAEITTLEARRDKTRFLKLGMMQELLTGKTRLVR